MTDPGLYGIAVPVVGLTGGIGAGKSTVASRFAELGVFVIDTDDIARQLTAAGGEAMGVIMSTFGHRVVSADGAMDRAAMREQVFSDPSARKQLECILHPLIYDKSVEILRRAVGPYAILVVPLLFEHARYPLLLTRSLVVDCDEVEQVRRASLRSGVNETMVRKVMATQMPRQQRNACADDIIINNGSLLDLERQVDEKHHFYLVHLATASQRGKDK